MVVNLFGNIKHPCKHHILEDVVLKLTKRTWDLSLLVMAQVRLGVLPVNNAKMAQAIGGNHTCFDHPSDFGLNVEFDVWTPFWQQTIKQRVNNPTAI
ncbi:hypothetical protein D3C75_1101350 [compost metagenome]